MMRKLVPGMSDKTDKATVFEFGARYIHFLKGFVGNKHDKVGVILLHLIPGFGMHLIKYRTQAAIHGEG